MRITKIYEMVREALPDHKVTLEFWSEWKGRMAGRIRASGRMYEGQRLTVLNPDGKKVCQHFTKATYKKNSQVIEWLEKYKIDKSAFHYGM